MDRVMECRTSRPKTLGLAALAALMTGLAALVVRLPLAAKTTPMNAGSANAVGVAGVLFFGTALALTLSRLTSKEPFVTIGDEGFRIRGAVGLVPWEAMVSVWVAVANGTGFVSIELEEPDAFLQKLKPSARWLARFAHALAFGRIAVCFRGLSPGLREAWEFMRTVPAARERMIGDGRGAWL